MKNLLYFGNIPAPYTVSFLNELGKSLNITALFERGKASDRSKQWIANLNFNFKLVILRSIKFKKEMGITLGFLKYFKYDYDFILIGNPLTPTGILTIFYLKFKKIKFGIISEGGFAKRGCNIKEKLKKSVISRASYYLSGSKPGNKYFLKYGATKNKIYEYPFSSMYKNEILENPVSFEEKNIIKKKFDFENRKVILAVGRVIESKGYDTLIKVASRLTFYSFVIVGGKATKKLLKQMNQLNLKNVRFVDHLSKSEIRDYYKMADIFLLPTRLDTYGLVVNEAMSFGLPVITTNKCVAGIHLIKNYINGFIINVDDTKNLINKIGLINNNKKLYKLISNNNIKKINNYSIESMAKSVEKALLKEIN